MSLSAFFSLASWAHSMDSCQLQFQFEVEKTEDSNYVDALIEGLLKSKEKSQNSLQNSVRTPDFFWAQNSLRDELVIIYQRPIHSKKKKEIEESIVSSLMPEIRSITGKLLEELKLNDLLKKKLSTYLHQEFVALVKERMKSYNIYQKYLETKGKKRKDNTFSNYAFWNYEKSIDSFPALALMRSLEKSQGQRKNSLRQELRLLYQGIEDKASPLKKAVRDSLF